MLESFILVLNIRSVQRLKLLVVGVVQHLVVLRIEYSPSGGRCLGGLYFRPVFSMVFKDP